MKQAASKAQKITKLRVVSSGSKIWYQLIIFLIIGILPLLFPKKISFPNQNILFFNLLIALLSSIAFEIRRNQLEKKSKDTRRLMTVQLLTSAILLTHFLHYFTRINSAFFILYLQTVMESALNLNVRLPNTVVLIMLFSTLGEFAYLVKIKEIVFSLRSSMELGIRMGGLMFMRSYGLTLAQTIIQEKEERIKTKKLAEDLKKAVAKIESHAEELKEKNRFLAALRRLDLIVMETLDTETLCQKIVDALSSELKCEFGLIGLINEAQNRFYFKAVTTHSQLAKIFIKKRLKLEEVFFPLDNESNLLIKGITTKRELSAENLADFFAPYFSYGETKKWQKNLETKTYWIYPVISKAKVLGVLVFGWKKKEREISSRERDLMQNIIDQASIALDNTLLYEQLKKSVQKLKRANLKLRELDRMKDEFVSIASHELRTPMTSVNNYLWMVLHEKGGKVSVKQRFYLERAAISTQRLISLVEDMLTVSRIEGAKLEINPLPGNIVKLTKEVAEELKVKARKGKVKVFFETPKKELPLVLMDEEKIREVLSNLFDNAIKFTPPKGKITISFKKKGRVISTIITDTGRGIAKTDIPKLFKKFGRLDRSFATVAETGGTGLGLYICKQIIDLHRGKISVRSKLKQGSTFYFDLRIAGR